MRLPEPMHPVAKRAAREAVRAGQGYAPRFLERLRDELLGCTGEPLRDAVRDLIFLAVVLEESGKLEAAVALYDLVESPAVIAALDRANASQVADRNDALARGAKRFARFEGSEVVTSAAEKSPGMKLERLGARRFAGLRLR